jgi:uncharacterized membrane protein YuzA (DUF378 family)
VRTLSTARTLLVVLGYLLGGFTGFQHLGNFNRLHLVCLVFGEATIEASICQALVFSTRGGCRMRSGRRSSNT